MVLDRSRKDAMKYRALYIDINHMMEKYKILWREIQCLIERGYFSEFGGQLKSGQKSTPKKVKPQKD